MVAEGVEASESELTSTSIFASPFLCEWLAPNPSSELLSSASVLKGFWSSKSDMFLYVSENGAAASMNNLKMPMPRSPAVFLVPPPA